MITPHVITRRADDDGVDAHVAERDYVLAHVVAQLPKAQMPDGGRLVFKGGTALRFVHVGDYRYSADLDFTVLDGTVDDGAAALSAAVAAAKEHAGFPTLEIQVGKTRLPRLLGQVYELWVGLELGRRGLAIAPHTAEQGACRHGAGSSGPGAPRG